MPKGLVNIGNTCSINTVIQCIGHCPTIRNFILTPDIPFIKLKNRNYSIYEELKDVFSHLWINNNSSTPNTTALSNNSTTTNNNNDGSIDQLFVLSDYHSHNQPTGRLHNGANADTISSLGVEDKITILGASTSELSIRQLTNGLGIFASGSLEAIVTDASWNATSLANSVFGDATRYS
jgi:hypothetical protein